MENYYALLGVSRKASLSEITKAYRRLARSYHPDRNSELEAGDKFRMITEAYRILREPNTRTKYDNWLKQNRSSTVKTWWRKARSTIQEHFATTARNEPTVTPKQTEPVRVLKIDLPVSEAINGTTKVLTCPESPENKFDLQIPAGTLSGETIHVPLPNTYGREIIAVINHKHDSQQSFERRGITIRVPITVTEAICGTRLPVQTATGQVMLRVPALSQNNQEFRIKGKGPEINGKNIDIYVKLSVETPDTMLDHELRQAANQLDRYYSSGLRQPSQSNATGEAIKIVE